jgi:intracellular septation protein
MKKLLFDLFPLVLFFIAFRFYGIYVATGVAIAASIGQFIWLKARRKVIEATHWINLTVIVVFGGATLFFQNDAFIKWKPTVLYWLFAAILVGSRLFVGKNLMQKLMGAQVSMPAPIWDKLNYAWAGFFVFSGALNLYVAFSGQFTESQWVSFKVFGLLVLLLGFVVAQSIWLGRHIQETSESGPVDQPTEPKEGS